MNDMWGNAINNPNLGAQRLDMNNYNYNRFLPHYEVIKVKGEASAQNFRMGPNSDALLLDETEPILYHVQTDGAGYLTVMSYNLVPRISAPPIDINQLAQRISQLEETLNARQSNSQSNKQQRKQRNTSTTNETSITDTSD